MSTNITVHGFAELVEALMSESDESLMAQLTKPARDVLRISIVSSPEPTSTAGSIDQLGRQS